MAVVSPSVDKICSRVQYSQLSEPLTSEQASGFEIEALQCQATAEYTPQM